MLLGKTRYTGRWQAACFDSSGRLKWSETWTNLVVNAGLDYALDVSLSGGTQITTWYLGLKGAGSVAAGDTMSSHAGWSEVTAYSNANRVTWTDGGVSGQSIDNSGSVAVFNINGTATVAGAFLTSNNTKSGTTGTLYAAGDFAASRSVVNGDTLQITATFTAAG